MINQKSTFLVKPRIFIFNFWKRLVDIFGSLFLLLIFSPIMIVTAIFIKISSPGPILFSQLRVGKNSRPFRMYKFRSMYIGDNDKRLKEEHPKLWEKYKASDWKLPLDEDPRITRVGKFIRKFTIDEFPQLFNVFIGNMSLVGPRAYREAELQEYAQKYPKCREFIDDIRRIKPGITGLWQTSGRNELPFEKRAQLDSYYVRNLSFRQDTTILLKTPLAMLSRW
jgi:lipopolysaccharide/colanic/teichoic acid biosynthesis glycosyltransferase